MVHLCYNRFVARKKTTASSSKTPAPKPAPRKKSPGRSSRASKTPRSSTLRSSKSKQPAAEKPARQGPKTPPPLVRGLSLDRKLDIIGVVLTLTGLLLFLSLVSASRSAFTQKLVFFLAKGFGWGGYFLPLALFGFGLWLILRNFDRIPGLDPEKISGIVLLFFNITAFFHFFLFAENRTAAFTQASQGLGGGYAGAFISETLISLVGVWGTAIALISWLVIGLALTFDRTVADLFRWAPPILKLFSNQVHKVRQGLAARLQRQLPQPAAVAAVPGPLNGQAPPLSPPTGENDGLSFEETPVVREWVLPPIDEILDQGQDVIHSDEFDRHNARLIEETLASFGAPATVVEIKHGPTITMFGVEPEFVESRSGKTRVRVNKITALADDLALALAAANIRIQAPVPGEGYIGIEVPNENIALVALRDVVESESFTRLPPPLRFALGQDVSGTPVSATLEAMPHLLIAGATGSGKSVCVNGIISAFLLNNTPDDLRMIMVDPKRVELTNYNGIPHLLAPVVVEMERVVGALQWVTREMDSRYQKFHDSRTRNLADYNRYIVENGGKKLPHLVVIIDELADLMMLAPDQTERAITRLAQLARATGIHLIIATQRPSVDVVTGLIKANFPARIAFAVASGVDSRVILDQPGAERLLGSGDMLFQSPDAPAPVRLQGVFVSDEEILRLVQYWRMQLVSQVDSSVMHSNRPADAPARNLPLKQKEIWKEMEEVQDDVDPMFDEAVDLIRRQGRASVSMLQRRLRIGYTRAARLIETLEAKGIVGPPIGGAQTREVLDYGPAAPPAGN